ncbi:MAG: ATP-binding protein [Candidatus Poribacteria bacterium]
MQNFFKEQIEPVYRAGMSHTFLLYLNVKDIMWDEIYGYLPMMEYLLEQLNAIGIEAVVGVQGGRIFLPKPSRIESPQRELWKLKAGANERKKINESLTFDDTQVIKGDKPHEWMGDKLNDLFYETRDFQLSVGLVINPIETHDYLKGNVKSWSTDFELRGRGCAIILTTFDASPDEDLSDNSEIRIVRVPYPDYEDRLFLIKHLINRSSQIGSEITHDSQIERIVTPERFAQLTSGLDLFTIYPLVLWAYGAGKYKWSDAQVSQVFHSLIEEQKQAAIKTKSHGMLQVMETAEYSFDKIGGLDYIKSYLSKITSAIVKGETSKVPMGILFLGPSGAGKTIVAKALARESGMTCVQLRNIKQICAGQNISLLIELIQMLAPVMVFIDDIDQPEGIRWGSGRDNDVPIPIELFAFMSNAKLRGKVLWVGASNRPDLIDAGFRKYGVFEEKLVFLMPEKNSREDMLRKMFVQNEIDFDSGLNFSNIADDNYTRGYTAAELDDLVKRSHRLAMINGREVVSEKDMIEAAEIFIPKYNQRMYEYLSLLAIREVNSKNMLPPTLPSYLQQIVYENGQISKGKIEKRLQQLASELKLR